jgi:hypothetical protein
MRNNKRKEKHNKQHQCIGNTLSWF